MVEKFGEGSSCTPEQLFGMINTFITGFERAHDENVRKLEQRNKPQRGAVKPSAFGAAGSAQAGNMNDMISQLKTGNYFR